MKLAGSTNIKAIVLGGLLVSAVALGAAKGAHAFGGARGHEGQGMRGGPGAMMPSFSELDSNGDGQISSEEFSARGAARFATVDINGDGLLSAEEMLAQALEQVQERATNGVARMIEHRDQNGDGLLSAEEMKPRENRAERMFSRLDGDEDGVISQAEFDAVKARMGQHRRGHGMGHGMGHGKGHGMGHGMDHAGPDDASNG